MKSHPPRFVARIGLDRADQKHDFCVRAGPKAQLEYGVVQHSPESIADWAHSLRQRFRGRPVAICLEHKAGPVVSALLKYSFITLFPISPRALARYRESFSQGGAKDDPTDACLQLDYLLKHPESLRPLIPDDPKTRILQQLVEDRRDFVQQKVDLTNALTASLKAYYPQALQWFGDIDTLLFCDFIAAWPTLAEAQAESEAALREFFKCRRCGREAVITKRLKAISKAMPLTEDERKRGPPLRKRGREKGDGFIFQIASQTALCASSSLRHFAPIIMIAELRSCLSLALCRWQFWSGQPYVANK